MVIYHLHRGYDRMPSQCSSPQQNQTPWHVFKFRPMKCASSSSWQDTWAWSQGTEVCFNFIFQPFTSHCKRRALSTPTLGWQARRLHQQIRIVVNVAKKPDNWYLNKVLLKSQSLSLQSCSTLKHTKWSSRSTMQTWKQISNPLLSVILLLEGETFYPTSLQEVLNCIKCQIKGHLAVSGDQTSKIME